MIIKASESQVELIKDLADQFSKRSMWSKNKPEVLFEYVRMMIRQNIGILFIYLKNSKAVGAICGMKHPSIFTGEMTATEFFWYADPGYPRTGIKLFDRFEKWAKEEKCKNIIMVHLADLMPEKIGKFYQRRGYKCLESHFIKEL